MSHHDCFIAVCLLVLGLCPLGARGQTESSEDAPEEPEAWEVYEDPDYRIEVRDRAEALSDRDPTLPISQIPERALVRAQRRGEQISELVDAAAGARILQLGGPVSDRHLTIHGGTPAQALVILDGLALSSPFATGFDLDLIPLDWVSSIELVHGGSAALLGDGALTGALVIRSRRPGGKKESASLSYGSLGFTRVSARMLSDRFAVGARLERTDGDFRYTSSIFGLEDVDEVRDNNDARRASMNLRMEQPLGATRLNLYGALSLREAGVPGLETQENQVAREARNQAYIRSEWVIPLPRLPRAKLSWGASASFLDIAYEDPSLFRESDTTFFVLSTDARLSLLVAETHSLRTSVEGSVERSRSTEHGQPQRLRSSVSVSDEVWLDAWTLFFALRAQALTDQPAQLLPRLGFRVDPGFGLTLSMAFGRSIRSPTLDELYHPSEAGFSGNPDLVPEQAWELQGTLKMELDLFQVALSMFVRAMDDTILYLNRNAFVVRPENVGASRGMGGDLELGFEDKVAGVVFSGSASLGLLFSELDVTGDRVPTEPRWHAAMQAGLGYGAWEWFSELRMVGPTTTHLRSSPETRVPTYLRWDSGLTFRPFSFLTTSLRVLNLLDRRTLRSLQKIPLPGRFVMFTLELSTEARDSALATTHAPRAELGAS